MLNATSLDFARYGGVWSPDAASLSPWNTHFSGESREPDARIIDSAMCLASGRGCLQVRDRDRCSAGSG